MTVCKSINIVRFSTHGNIFNSMKRYSIVSEWQIISENAKSQFCNVPDLNMVVSNPISQCMRASTTAELLGEAKQSVDGWAQSKNAVFNCL